MADRISLRQVAREASVSLATVSMALRGDTRILPATRELVLAAARRLGYEPNPTLSALAQQRWQTTGKFGGNILAVVYHDKGAEKLSRDAAYFSPEPLPSYQQPGVAAYASKLGYGVETFNLATYPNGRALGRVLHQRGIRGIILAPLYEPIHEPAIEWAHFSVVSLGASLFQTPFHTVDLNCHDQIMLALERIINLGYRRIGVVLLRHSINLIHDEEREGACLVAATKWKSLGVKIPLLLHTADLSSDAFQDRYVAWFKKHKPECILGFSNGYKERLTLGPRLRCPEDFGFASLHLMGDTDNINCAGIPINDTERGRYAVYLLDLLLRGKETGLPLHPIVHKVGFEWRDGATLPPVRNG
ncbi:MAG: LacI family DNA-binding transcriptional regulator [Verrucomicrobiota bacterium]|nr:LacI family DNA-binding transcriptional regulator [Verrucomicrobiota bacterium]